MKLHTFLLAVSLLAFGAAYAVEVDCTPGTLASRLGTSAATESTLTVRGSLDARDLFFIADEMPALRTLDLAGANIAAYSGERLKGNLSYPAATIPAMTFAGSRITEITFPAAGVTLGNGALAGSALTSLTLTPKVDASGSGVFSDCAGLTSIATGGATLGDHMFMGLTALTAADLSGNTELPEGIFQNCTALQSVTGSESLTAIGACAFDGCTALKQIALKDIRIIGDRAFYGCGLTSIDLADATSLKTIGRYAFADEPALASATLPGSVTSVGAGAFFNCTALSAVVFPAIDMAAYTFTHAPLSASGETLLPEGLTSIGDYALADASGLSTLQLPSTLSYLGDGAMEKTISLKTIDAETVKEVPALGESVWAGIDQSTVSLDVSPDLAPAFRAAEQWNEFNVNAQSTLTEDMVAPAALEARFVGPILEVRSSGAEIAAVSLYDIAGNLLMRSGLNASEGSLDTSAIGGNLFIVRLQLADGTDRALKMLR